MYKIENFTITFIYGDVIKIELPLDVILDPFFNFKYDKYQLDLLVKNIKELEDIYLKNKFVDMMSGKSKSESNVIFLWHSLLNKLIQSIYELEICAIKQLYFMQSETGLIKIGISKNPEKRRVSLENEMKEKIVILKTLQHSEYERNLHKSFHCYNAFYKGYTEWFTPYPDLLEFVDSVDDSNFISKYKKIKPKYAK